LAEVQERLLALKGDGAFGLSRREERQVVDEFLPQADESYRTHITLTSKLQLPLEADARHGRVVRHLHLLPVHLRDLHRRRGVR
jgi:hypothetical protein